MASDNSTSDNKSKYGIAILSLIGVLAAAIIAIAPQIIELLRQSRNESSSTPIAINKYDDPSNILSIEYPINLHLTSRKINGKTLEVFFNTPLDLYPKEFFYISVETGLVSERPFPIASNDDFIASYIKNVGITDSDQTFMLLSNTKTQKGYYTVIEETDKNPDAKSYIHWLIEIDGDTYAIVKIGVTDNLMSDEAIANIISSFSWSSSQITEFFK